MVARRAHNPKVVGSSPASATIENRLNAMFKRFYFLFRDFVFLLSHIAFFRLKHLQSTKMCYNNTCKQVVIEEYDNER